jgi:D-glycero-D-manno-heptose 1,7-bisphosphate phosphatase
LLRPAVFLDRDGVINERRLDHVRSWSEFSFRPDVLEMLPRLASTGAAVVVVTNQSVVGRGLISAAELHDIHGRMVDAIAAAGGHITAVYVCMHAPEDGCDCRKPAPALLFQASRELGISLSESVMIGDELSDVLAAAAADCIPILVDPNPSGTRPGDFVVVSSFREAVDLVTDAVTAEVVAGC